MTPLEAEQEAPIPSAPYPDATGNDISLTELLDQGPLLLGIYKSSCAASKAMMPALQLALDTYGDAGLLTAGVSQDSANITRSFARRGNIHYPILIEGEEYPISIEFDIFATPTIYLIRQDKSIAYTTMGFFRQQIADLSAAIASVLNTAVRNIIPEDNADFPKFVPG